MTDCQPKPHDSKTQSNYVETKLMKLATHNPRDKFDCLKVAIDTLLRIFHILCRVFAIIRLRVIFVGVGRHSDTLAEML